MLMLIPLYKDCGILTHYILHVLPKSLPTVHTSSQTAEILPAGLNTYKIDCLHLCADRPHLSTEGVNSMV